MKFKIGDKVRVVEWLDMPQKLQDGMGMNARCIGEVLTVVKLEAKYSNIPLYYLVGPSTEDTGLLVFELEIEPEIKVGQQLLFWEE